LLPLQAAFTPAWPDTAADSCRHRRRFSLLFRPLPAVFSRRFDAAAACHYHIEDHRHCFRRRFRLLPPPAFIRDDFAFAAAAIFISPLCLLFAFASDFRQLCSDDAATLSMLALRHFSLPYH
jgi:hypothetical protein